MAGSPIAFTAATSSGNGATIEIDEAFARLQDLEILANTPLGHQRIELGRDLGRIAEQLVRGG
jgi:hypothetical protein